MRINIHKFNKSKTVRKGHKATTSVHFGQRTDIQTTLKGKPNQEGWILYFFKLLSGSVSLKRKSTIWGWISPLSTNGRRFLPKKHTHTHTKGVV